MNEGLIALLSIFFGIIGANAIILLRKKSSLALKGNTLVGVFSSVFIIKSFGRLGFDPTSIVTHSEDQIWLLAANLSVSFFSGLFGVLLAQKVIMWATKDNNPR